MRSSDHLGDTKMSKKAPRFVEFNFLRFSQKERMKTDLQNFCLRIFQIFAQGLRYDLSKLSN